MTESTEGNDEATPWRRKALRLIARQEGWTDRQAARAAIALTDDDLRTYSRRSLAIIRAVKKAREQSDELRDPRELQRLVMRIDKLVRSDPEFERVMAKLRSLSNHREPTCDAAARSKASSRTAIETVRAAAAAAPS